MFYMHAMDKEAYYRSLKLCVPRYKEMANSLPELLSFIWLFDESIDAREPLMKLNRWLGYIQGVLIANGKTSVLDERNFTRPLFKSLDYMTNYI